MNTIIWETLHKKHQGLIKKIYLYMSFKDC